MTSNEAIQILLDANHIDRNAALTHVLHDLDSLRRMDQMVRAILSDVDYELSCAEARLHLASYYEWQQNQANRFPLLEDVQAHVGRCPYCQAELHMLQESMTELARESPALEKSPRIFDLSFIDAPLLKVTPTSAIWRFQEQIRRLFDQLQITISETTATIASLTPQLAPIPVVSAMLGEDDIQFSTLVLPDLEAKIHFQIDSKPSRDGTALITLRIFETEGDTPLPDVRVTLRDGEGNLIAGSLTGPSGDVSFPRIPADRYLVQAQYQDKTWELPVSIVRSQA